MPVTCTLHCRGWDLLGLLRQEAYTGPAHYATENGEAGSAADDVREHWARRQVRCQHPSLATTSCWSPCVVFLHVVHWPLHATQHSGCQTQSAEQAGDRVKFTRFMLDDHSMATLQQDGQPEGPRVRRSSAREQRPDLRSSADSRQSDVGGVYVSRQDPLTDRSRQLR